MKKALVVLSIVLGVLRLDLSVAEARTSRSVCRKFNPSVAIPHDAQWAGPTKKTF